MKKLPLALLAALTVGLLAPAPAAAQTVKLPAEVRGEDGLPIQIIAEADGDNVVWLTPDPGLVCIDGGFFKGDSKRAICFGKAGTYRLWALTAKGDAISQRAECIVRVGGAPPPPPGPGPAPPGPVDPLTASLQVAYDSEPDLLKVTRLPVLASIMAEAADSARSADVRTVKQLVDAVHVVTERKVGPKAAGALSRTRDAVGAYLNPLLPKVDQPLTDADRATIAADYAKVAAALRRVKP